LTICRNFDLNQSRESRSQNQSTLSKYDSRLSLSRTLSTASKSRSCPLSKPETTRDPVSHLDRSITDSDGTVLDSIAAKNIEIGSLKEQVYSLQKQLREVNQSIDETLPSDSEEDMIIEKRPSTKFSDSLKKNASQEELLKHLGDLQHENENLNETVRELRDRLMLHAAAEDSEEDDAVVEEVQNDRDTENTDNTANTAKSNAKSRSSYAAPYFPTSNIYSTM